MIKNKFYWYVAIILVLLFAGIYVGFRYMGGTPEGTATKVINFNIFDKEFHEHTVGDYSLLVDDKGNVLDMMARRVYVGDEFIAADNRRYRVSRVEGNKGICELVGVDDVSWEELSQEIGELGDVVETAAEQVQARGTQTIGIYYTHEGESYVPTDGRDNIPGNGGILQVGKLFAERLRGMGINIIDDKTSHAPHDDAAYKRSRRTAINLFKQGAGAVFDIHRDGVDDANFYRQVINNQSVTKVRLVVGRQNQNMNANLDYAKRLKSAADKKYPGLIQGIFIGAGSYNQDLSPRSMLLEVGTHTNSRTEAERGVKLFADIVPTVLGTIAGPTATRTRSTSSDWLNTLYIVVAVVIGGGVFLLVSTGSWDKAVERLKQITSIEWLNLIGWRRNKKE